MKRINHTPRVRPPGEWAVASYIDIDSNKKHFAKTNKHTMRADGYPPGL